MIEKEAERLREARQVDELVRAAMHRLGIPITNPKSFDELVASGELKAAECFVMSKNMVDPDWLERAMSGDKDLPFRLTVRWSARSRNRYRSRPWGDGL